ncbi:DUF5672 family protein [Algoriphagus sp. D3-2-R+10]|uniref:DUF5672 family protein n=1 Tax=Algoriphagus aurantiacus TaxID=3103948 RepID=UPI002B395746|nr:DUF5672 family protein [Algoriphagus sp. D3-2-R+10]MEB2777656.1 DUF5672 family protein [Algoriphagus sp. D3-2-R+10]
MKKIGVLISFYKSKLSANEILSLKRCVSILGKHDLILFGPNNIDLSLYLEHAVGAKTHLVPGELLKGADNYSKYLLSEDFYNFYKDYDHILLYQLDCYVFRDDLRHWVSKNYDFIGSPFFEDFERTTTNKLSGVGNGGFSLRAPNKILEVLENWEKKITYESIIKNKEVFLKGDKIRLISQKFLSSLTGYKFHIPYNKLLKVPKDDLMIGLFFSKELNLIRTPSPIEASKFAMETNCSYLYELNGKVLPFGCHAWEKYEPIFWKNFILNESEDNLNIV